MATGGQDDPDQDGQTNREEYEAGTDPRDSRSRLRVEVLAGSSPLRCRLNAVAGRTYSLVATDQLPGSGWQVVTQIPATTADRVVELELPPPLEAAPRFYRWVTPQVP
jgi:hypothetical protein